MEAALQTVADAKYDSVPTSVHWNLTLVSTNACGVDLVYWILWLLLGMLVLVGHLLLIYRMPLTLPTFFHTYVAYPGYSCSKMEYRMSSNIGNLSAFIWQKWMLLLCYISAQEDCITCLQMPTTPSPSNLSKHCCCLKQKSKLGRRVEEKCG